jgi:tryptophan synthase alpha subunit
MMNEYKLDALLLPDIPLEEIQEYRKMKWINNIMLVSNNLDDETIIDIAKNSSWFLYVLSFVGTTWAKENYKESVQKNLKQFVLRLRRLLWDEKKLVVWFGIKNKEDIDFLRTIPVDGFIIWSQIAKELQVWWTQALQTYIDNLWLT